MWLSPSSTAARPPRPYKGDARDTLSVRKVRQIRPDRPVGDWKVEGNEEAIRRVAIVGMGVRAAHEAAATAFEVHGPIQEIRALLLVQSARASVVDYEGLFRALGCSRAALAIQGTALQLKADVQRVPWETAEEGIDNPSPRGHLLIV